MNQITRVLFSPLELIHLSLEWKMSEYWNRHHQQKGGGNGKGSKNKHSPKNHSINTSFIFSNNYMLNIEKDYAQVKARQSISLSPLPYTQPSTRCIIASVPYCAIDKLNPWQQTNTILSKQAALSLPFYQQS